MSDAVKKYSALESYPKEAKSILFWLNIGLSFHVAIYILLGMCVLIWNPMGEIYLEPMAVGGALFSVFGMMQFWWLECSDDGQGYYNSSSNSLILTKKIMFCVLQELIRLFMVAIMRHDFFEDKTDYVNATYSAGYGGALPSYISSTVMGYILAFSYKSSHTRAQFVESQQEWWGRVLVEKNGVFDRPWFMVLYLYLSAAFTAMIFIGLTLIMAKFYPFFFLASIPFSMVVTVLEYFLVDVGLPAAALGLQMIVGIGAYFAGLSVWGVL